MSKNKKALGRLLASKSTKRVRTLISNRKGKVIEDLSIYEGQKDKLFLTEIGKRATRNAVNENRAMGIPVTFLQNDWIVRRLPDGRIERLKQVVTGSKEIHGRKLKKGTVIHVKSRVR